MAGARLRFFITLIRDRKKGFGWKKFFATVIFSICQKRFTYLYTKALTSAKCAFWTRSIGSR